MTSDVRAIADMGANDAIVRQAAIFSYGGSNQNGSSDLGGFRRRQHGIAG